MGFSVGLENGDLLFLSFFGITGMCTYKYASYVRIESPVSILYLLVSHADFGTAHENLKDVLLQTYRPLSDEVCCA
jgi:hypothetical protein